MAETFRLAAQSLGGEAVLQLQRRSLARRIRGPACRRDKRPYRVLDSLSRRDRTCKCGEAMQPMASDLLDRISWDQAEEFRGRTWRDLGLPPKDVVVASFGDSDMALLLP